jgi:hypothetical protein
MAENIGENMSKKGVDKTAKPGVIIPWKDLAIDKKDHKNIKPDTIDTAKPVNWDSDQAPE